MTSAHWICREMEEAEELAKQAADDALGEIHSYMELLEASRSDATHSSGTL